MSMDGLCLYASVLDMRRELTGGKIDRIQQPEKDELLLSIRSASQNYKLLINVSAADNRVHITDERKQSPTDAPMFCMLLRKRITAGRILGFEQTNTDRVLSIGIETYNELGDLAEFTLNCELMGKHSNIILVSDNGTVIDAIKHVGFGMSSVRPMMPGVQYSLPPAQDKLDPLSAEKSDFEAALCAPTDPAKALSQAFFGISPQSAASLLDACGREGLADFFAAFRQSADAYVAVDENGAPTAVYPYKPRGMTVKETASIGEAYDLLYAERERTQWIKRHGASARKIIDNNIARCEKKLELYADALNAAESMEKNRLCGELVTANLHALKPGLAKVALDNYYTDPPEKTVIALDPLLTPGENAQRFFKKYQKQKAARDMAAVQREAALEELSYLEGQLDNLAKCTAENELAELIDELKAEGYIKAERGARKKQKLPASKPMRFVSSDGIELLVGKNNVQNDRLTLKTALPNEMWLHTKNIPGSHVIIRREGDIPDTTLYEAAVLAAFYSRARGGTSVPVDYTPRKYVKKPAGAKPGMVIYSTNRTIYVTPDEALVRRLAGKSE